MLRTNAHGAAWFYCPAAQNYRPRLFENIQDFSSKTFLDRSCSTRSLFTRSMLTFSIRHQLGLIFYDNFWTRRPKQQTLRLGGNCASAKSGMAFASKRTTKRELVIRSQVALKLWQRKFEHSCHIFLTLAGPAHSLQCFVSSSLHARYHNVRGIVRANMDPHVPFLQDFFFHIALCVL